MELADSRKGAQLLSLKWQKMRTPIQSDHCIEKKVRSKLHAFESLCNLHLSASHYKQTTKHPFVTPLMNAL